MFQLMNLLIQYTDRISGSTDVMVGENPGQNTPAESYRGMVEQGSQVYNMVFKRIWRAMKEEFKKRHRMNAMYMPTTKRFGVGNSVVRREDYRSNPDLVVPSADPNVTSNQQRMVQAQALRMAARESPGYDITEVEKNFLRALRLEGIDKYYPGPDKRPAPPDPRVTLEEMKQKGKAFQLDHDKKMFALGLMEEHRVNNAKIAQLNAQAMKLVSEAGVAQADVQIKAIQTIVDALATHNDMISQQLESMEGEGDEAGSTGGGGVSGVAGGPSNPEIPGAVKQLAGQLEGSMGGGEVPE
jgi:hypothetical protein